MLMGFISIMIIGMRPDYRADHSADARADCRSGSGSNARDYRTRHGPRARAYRRSDGSASNSVLSCGIGRATA